MKQPLYHVVLGGRTADLHRLLNKNHSKRRRQAALGSLTHRSLITADILSEGSPNYTYEG